MNSTSREFQICDRILNATRRYRVAADLANGAIAQVEIGHHCRCGRHMDGGNEGVRIQSSLICTSVSSERLTEIPREFGNDAAGQDPFENAIGSYLSILKASDESPHSIIGYGSPAAVSARAGQPASAIDFRWTGHKLTPASANGDGACNTRQRQA